MNAIRIARAIAVAISAVAIPTAFAGAVIGWNEMALAGCITAVTAAAIVLATNKP
jgi:hypothetical protein